MVMPRQIGGGSLYANRCAQGLRNNAIGRKDEPENGLTCLAILAGRLEALRTSRPVGTAMRAGEARRAAAP